MKISIQAQVLSVLSALLVTSTASASWYQEWCANAEGTVAAANGHNQNDVVLTQRTWGQGPRGYTDAKLTFEPRAIKIDELEEKQLHEDVNKGCAADQQFGFYSSTQVSYKSVVLTKYDGTTFPKDTVGASQDLKSVKAFLICERHVTSQVMCENN